ncbi:MAG: COR domain-containing protein [Bacteroidota bacterium]
MLQEVLRRISKNKETQTKRLDLSWLEISKIPEELSECIWLEELYLRFTKIGEIEGLDNLKNLHNLDLSSTQIIDLKGLDNLSNLKRLSLRSTHISELRGLSSLEQLKELDLSFTKVRKLNGIEMLGNLERLFLNSTKVKDLSGIENLTNLKALNISKTEISNLKPLLNFIKNGLELTWIEKLYPRNLEIVLYDNPLIKPPIEIVTAGNQAVINYFDSLSDGEETVHEAKLIIIGEAGVGKTTFARKLCDFDADMPDESKDTTKGVTVHEERIIEKGKPDFLMHIWDFGGQEVYHSTHQFFLSNRSLYTLILDGRKEEDPNYWLQIQDLLGEDSPILILLNKKGPIRENVAIHELSSFYPNLRKPLAIINLKEDKDKIIDYRDRISYYIRNLPHFQKGYKVPKKWGIIRKKLENYRQQNNYISLQKFREICREEKIVEPEKQNFLADFLHSLGVILHFDSVPLLKKMVILNPEWATGAVYKVLNHTAVRKGLPGHFSKTDLSKVWADLSYQDVFDELLALMEKFELCYKLPGNNEEYIIPQLMSNDHPGYNWSNEDQLQVQYHYAFMPKGIVTRLIVRLHESIKNQSSVWMRGAIFELRSTNAEVIENYRDNQIHIKAKGKDRKELLGMILREIDSINKTFDFGGKLRVEKLLPCNCSVCKASTRLHFFKYSTIIKAREIGVKSIQCQDSFKSVPVASLLEDIFEKDNMLAIELKEILKKQGIKDFFEIIKKKELDFYLQKVIDPLDYRYQTLENKINTGTISEENANIELNKISRSILDLLNNFEEDYF